MSTQARDALRLLVAAMETHLDAVSNRRGPIDASVDDAYDAVAEAFETYEESLDVEFAESLPLVLEDDVEYGDDEDGPEEDVATDVEEEIDAHAEEDEDDMDDDLDDFDLR